jgi:large subunit ribosomal protein L7Ae
VQNQAETLFKLLLKYRPEDKKEKAERLKAEAEARAAGKVGLALLCWGNQQQQ